MVDATTASSLSSSAKNLVRMTRWSSSLWDLQTRSGPSYTTSVDANPTGEVYKVGSDRINRREHGVLQILAAEPETVAFVPVYAFYDFSTAFDLTGWSMGETVVAMEFVEDDGTEPDDHDLTILIDRLVTLEVSDHDENWRVRNGRPVIIDCGGF
jgi:hypothetical protein